MSEITIELIDALLTPPSPPQSSSNNGSFSNNNNAESIYKSIPIPTRIKSLLSLLQPLLQDSSSVEVGSTTIPRCMLISVLLRRDVSSLGSYSIKNVKLTSEWEIVRLLGEMVSPLLSIFIHGCDESNPTNSSNSNGNSGGVVGSHRFAGIQRQIGYILSEVCSSLSVMEDSISIDVMNVVMDQIEPGCSNANKACLELFSSLAQQSPLSLIKAKGSTLLHILQNAITTLQQSTQSLLSTIDTSISTSSTTNSTNFQTHYSNLQILLQHYQIIIQAMNHLAIASDIPYPQSLSENPKERMVQLIQIMSSSSSSYSALNSSSSSNSSDVKKLKIVPQSNGANVGKSCIPVVLNDIHAIINAIGALAQHSSDDNNNNGSYLVQDTIQEIMQTISQCASSYPTLLAVDYDILSIVCKTLISIGEKKELQPMVRLASCEALVTLCMVPDVRNVLTEQLVLKNLCLVGKKEDHNSSVGGIVGICAELLIDGVDDDVNDWAVEDVALQDEMQWDNDDISNFAEMILYSFLQNGGGGSQSLPAILSIVERLLQSSRWQELRAGLIIIDACLTTSPHSFSSHIPVAIEAALSFCNHECVRVQYQAIELLGSLCQHDSMSAAESQSKCIRQEHGRRILQSLAQLLMSNCPKVVCHACLGIVSFCRAGNGKENAGLSIDKSLLLPYLGDLLNAIAAGPLLKDITSNVVVYIRAFASVACLADVAGSDFATFYERIIKGLMDCVSFGLFIDTNGVIKSSGQNSHESVSLRGAAIEAATIVGQSIGDEDDRFHPEAETIMNMVIPLLNQKSTFVPQDQLLSAAARISAIIGAAYNPYVPSVLPFLLEIANEETDVAITEGNPDSSGEDGDYDEDDGFQSMTLNLPGVGAKKFTLNTSQIQDKILSARAVYEHANAMGADFGPYVKDCLEAFVPLLQFKYSAEVRATSAQALYPIFDAAFELLESSQSSSHVDLIASAYPRVLLLMSYQLNLEETDDIETMTAMSDSLSNICYAGFSHKKQDGTYFARLNQDQAQQFTINLLKAISACLDRRSHVLTSMARFVDEDQQAELQDILTVESEFFTNLVDSIGYNLKCLRLDFVPIFDKYIVPMFGPLLTLSGTRDTRARFGALCLFCDCVEHCGSDAAARYGVQLCDGCVQGIDDSTNCDDIGLKEVSVYSIAQIARHAPHSTLLASVGNISLRLLSIAKEAENKEKDDIEDLRLVENAASALATLTLFENSPFKQIDGIQRSYILETFLSNLPITMDEDEAKYCHQGLCELIEKADISPQENLYVLIQIIGQIAAAVVDEEDVATQDTCRRLFEILNNAQKTNPAHFQQAYSNLSERSLNGINVLFGLSSN